MASIGPAEPGNGPRALPPAGAGLSRTRRRLGFGLVLVGLPLLTAALILLRDRASLETLLLIYLLAVVIVAVLGGVAPAVLAAIASFLLANWFLTRPYYTFAVESADRAVELAVFVVIAVVVSLVVDVGARHRASAERNRSEALLLSRLSAVELGGSSVERVLEQVRNLFGMTGVALVRQSDPSEVVASVGPTSPGEPSLQVATAGGLAMIGYGPELLGADRHVLEALAGMAARVFEEHHLRNEAQRAEQLVETDRVRSAVLAAVGHDLRTPLAGMKVAVSTLRQTDVVLTDAERDELLASIESDTDRLTDLISRLMAMSRIQAGALSVHPSVVLVDEVVGRSLRDLGQDHSSVTVDIPDDLPSVHVDSVLLEEVVTNLLGNALRFSSRVEIAAAAVDEEQVVLRIVDHGPGVPEERWEEMFLPFQRLDDHTPSGVGLGLAIARGFTQAMGATLTPGQTPGGGLTMTISLPVAR
jgi:K+-sensing histidine kinase KdpD